VTDDREARPNVWVAALVQTNCERRIADKLNDLSILSFVPLQEEIHQWNDRKKKINRVVIPNIVFIKTPRHRFDEIRRLSFIHGLMTNPGDRRPAIIPDEQIETLKFMLRQSDSPVFINTDTRSLKRGERVRVIRGSFQGMEGIVFRLQGDLHIGILIENLGFAHVSISLNDIEKI